MQVNKFYALWVNYLPNSAISNRMLAYLEAWSKMKVDVTVVFTLPDRSFSKVPYSYPNINFVYLWEKFPIRIRIVHYLLYILYIKCFLNSLKDNDYVYVYGQANLLPITAKKRELLVFHETTEHPSVIPLGIKFHTTTVKDYLNSCKRLNGIFVISTFLKDYLVDKGVDPSRVEIVNMVVDPSRFEGLEKQSTRKYIAYCGNASNNKDGVDRLIKAFALISSKYEDLYLYIIGKAPDTKELDNNGKLAEKLGIADKVIFTGMVKSVEMPQLLKDAEILALARPNSVQAKYGFPTKLGEYLLTANPVVITDTGDIHRFLKDKESAMIASADNVEEFAQKIIWLLEHTQEALLIGSNGKRVALEHFNAEIEAKKIINYMFRI